MPPEATPNSGVLSPNWPKSSIGIVQIIVGDITAGIGQRTDVLLAVLPIEAGGRAAFLTDQLAVTQDIACLHRVVDIRLDRHIAIGRGFIPQVIGDLSVRDALDAVTIHIVGEGRSDRTLSGRLHQKGDTKQDTNEQS